MDRHPCRSGPCGDVRAGIRPRIRGYGISSWAGAPELPDNPTHGTKGVAISRRLSLVSRGWRRVVPVLHHRQFQRLVGRFGLDAARFRLSYGSRHRCQGQRLAAPDRQRQQRSRQGLGYRRQLQHRHGAEDHLQRRQLDGWITGRRRHFGVPIRRHPGHGGHHPRRRPTLNQVVVAQTPSSTVGTSSAWSSAMAPATRSPIWCVT